MEESLILGEGGLAAGNAVVAVEGNVRQSLTTVISFSRCWYLLAIDVVYLLERCSEVVHVLWAIVQSAAESGLVTGGCTFR